MTPDEIRTLYEYDAWANHRLLDAAAALSAEQFTRDLGSSFPSVRDTLAHIMFAQWIWLERWQGRAPQNAPSATDFPNVASLRKRWAEVEADLLAFVRGLTSERIAAVREYKTWTMGTFTNSLGDMLHHVANHGTYHRGQVTTMLRQLGANAVATDFVYFLRERGAAASAR